MLQLLSPLALLALAALAIPAILHLWRPPAKTVRVGTLRYFTGPATRRLNKLRWRELLLLIVRVLLLALLAFLLAEPFWKRKPPAGARKWALLEHGLVLNEEAQERWQTLQKAGYETRHLASGFARVARDPISQAKAESVDVWSLLKEADALLPAGSQLAVFASGRAASLRGERPQMRNCEVEWIHGAAPNDEARVWLQTLRVTNDRQLQLRVGRSDARSTEFISATIPAAAGKTAMPKPLDAWSLEVDGEPGAFRARLAHRDEMKEGGPWITATAPEPLRAAILNDLSRAEDARYLEAAWRAMAAVAGRPAMIHSDPQQADWIFWLNDQPPSPEVLEIVRERGVSLLLDAENSVTGSASPANWFLDERVPLFRRTHPRADDGATIWSDSFGAPLLTVKAEGLGKLWRFASRFHPSWNDLPRSSALPAALRSILAANESSTAADRSQDMRLADPDQARPANRIQGNAKGGARLSPDAETVDLHSAIWLLCLLFFIAERVLSHRAVNSVSATPAAPDVKREEVLA